MKRDNESKPLLAEDRDQAEVLAQEPLAAVRQPHTDDTQTDAVYVRDLQMMPDTPEPRHRVDVSTMSVVVLMFVNFKPLVRACAALTWAESCFGEWLPSTRRYYHN